MSEDNDKEVGPQYDMRTAMTDKQLASWCNYNKIPFYLVDLDKLDSSNQDSGYVFTGSEKNDYNNGNAHHWLAFVGNKVFDSYGMRDYKIPENYEFMSHKPKQLQHFDSNVCGEYCSLLLKILSQDPSADEDNVAQKLIEQYGLGNNHTNNDRIVYNAFKNAAPENVAKGLPQSGESAKTSEQGGSTTEKTAGSTSEKPSVDNSNSDTDGEKPQEC